MALVVTVEGFPLAYEVLAGNTADSKTLEDFLNTIEKRYGRAHRILPHGSRHTHRGALGEHARAQHLLSRRHAQGALD